MSARQIQLLLVAGAVALSVLLFAAPRTDASEAKKGGPQTSAGTNSDARIDIYLRMAMKAMDAGLRKEAEGLAASKKFDSLTVFWDRLKRPDLAAYYAEEKAGNSAKPADWLSAANRYYNAVQFCRDQSEIPLLFGSAIRCVQKSLELEPANNDARILLASCYVEGTGDPMKGISLLREVEKSDSNNVKLQLAFAFFSVKSGQPEKAIARFQKILAVDSGFIEAYLHLADLYERGGNRSECITMLQRYAALTPDITEKLEVEKYIEELKTDL